MARDFTVTISDEWHAAANDQFGMTPEQQIAGLEKSTLDLARKASVGSAIFIEIEKVREVDPVKAAALEAEFIAKIAVEVDKLPTKEDEEEKL